ncbi:hypothetical protein PUMCH_003422 [Australozyma saopauloensis]|uniref:Uncharacterized protein n=1 Tax=Australozyma saopauloensis TaxID=291208 RepID=A0AAX4HCR9_9ASCO|nr:hypothetical protein PUMCH_003422 [[Candida] saopauloensis]
MKRKTYSEELLDQCRAGLSCLKRDRPNHSNRVPGTLLPNPIDLGNDTRNIIRSNLVNNGGPRFLIFLDAQGKEFIDDIADMCAQFVPYMIFISLNIQPCSLPNTAIQVADTEVCKFLAKELGILDPVGGGAYPLNKLVVMDSQALVHCLIPLRVSKFCAPHQRFGTDLALLPGILEEYMDYSWPSDVWDAMEETPEDILMQI